MNHSIKFIITIANVIIPSVPVILHQKIYPDSKNKKNCKLKYIISEFMESVYKNIYIISKMKVQWILN